MITRILDTARSRLTHMGEAIFFLGEILRVIGRGKVRFNEVLNQMYTQGVQSIVIVILTSFASGMVLAHSDV